MTKQDLYKLIAEEIMPQKLEIMKGKGEAYSGQEDKLGNFKRCARLAGVKTEVAWFVYFVKHFDALTSFIRGEYVDTESIKGRILDLSNYLDLLYAILKERGDLDGKSNKA